MKLVINPNEKALVYSNSRFLNIYNEGVYRIFSWFKTITVYPFSVVEKMVTIINQEILTKDNIALRLSFYYTYQISDLKKISEKFSLNGGSDTVVLLIEQKLSNLIKVEIRKRISTLTIFELNEKRENLFEGIIASLSKEVGDIGIIILNVTPMDFSFPKNIQDIFAKLVESKVRAQTDLENARTQVATVRTLKNAAELMKGDENLKYFQFLETITRIASKGNHSFVIGTDEFKKN